MKNTDALAGTDRLAVRGGVVTPTYAPASASAPATRTGTDPDPVAHLGGEEALQKIEMLLKHFRSAMLTTVTDGTVHTRPMGLQRDKQHFDGSLWFFTDDRNAVLDEVADGAPASLVFQCDKENAYLHLSGKAAVSRDREKMRELYTPTLKTWFPDGLDDPHLTLIRFDADSGRYWDSPGGIFQLLGAFAKAVITHEPAAGGEKGELALR